MTNNVLWVCPESRIELVRLLVVAKAANHQSETPPPTTSFPQVKSAATFWCCGCARRYVIGPGGGGVRMCRGFCEAFFFFFFFFLGGDSLIYMFLCLQSSFACVHKWTADVNWSSRHITDFQGCQERLLRIRAHRLDSVVWHGACCGVSCQH